MEDVSSAMAALLPTVDEVRLLVTQLTSDEIALFAVTIGPVGRWSRQLSMAAWPSSYPALDWYGTVTTIASDNAQASSMAAA